MNATFSNVTGRHQNCNAPQNVFRPNSDASDAADGSFAALAFQLETSTNWINPLSTPTSFDNGRNTKFIFRATLPCLATDKARRTFSIRGCASQESGRSVSEWLEEATLNIIAHVCSVRGSCVCLSGGFDANHE